MTDAPTVHYLITGEQLEQFRNTAILTDKLSLFLTVQKIMQSEPVTVDEVATKPTSAKKRPGRKPGSKNKPKTEDAQASQAPANGKAAEESPTPLLSTGNEARADSRAYV